MENTTRKFVTMKDWEAARDFDQAAKPGDIVEEAIVWEFLNCLPPVVNWSHLMQCGEPHSHELDPATGRWRATYATFHRTADGWVYCGNCFAGETTEPAKKKKEM